nr:hypothetical protein B0A51_16492 [Rachicladosporium sp. CCFEE 5018]
MGVSPYDTQGEDGEMLGDYDSCAFTNGTKVSPADDQGQDGAAIDFCLFGNDTVVSPDDDQGQDGVVDDFCVAPPPITIIPIDDDFCLPGTNQITIIPLNETQTTTASTSRSFTPCYTANTAFATSGEQMCTISAVPGFKPGDFSPFMCHWAGGGKPSAVAVPAMTCGGTVMCPHADPKVGWTTAPPDMSGLTRIGATSWLASPGGPVQFAPDPHPLGWQGPNPWDNPFMQGFISAMPDPNVAGLIGNPGASMTTSTYIPSHGKEKLPEATPASPGSTLKSMSGPTAAPPLSKAAASSKVVLGTGAQAMAQNGTVAATKTLGKGASKASTELPKVGT